MASIKGVMLLPLDAESYRRHMAHHTFLAKVNSGTKTPDSRLELTQLVEERVRQEMQLRFSATRFRVLRWEQVDLRNRYVVRFGHTDLRSSSDIYRVLISELGEEAACFSGAYDIPLQLIATNEAARREAERWAEHGSFMESDETAEQEEQL